jgi:4-hydroxy-tetrahydrodipicolinate reductase
MRVIERILMNIYLAGKTGRTGSTIAQLINEHEKFSLIDTVEQANSIIDFSVPENTVKLAIQAAELNIPMVTGTTGLDDNQQQAIAQAATRVAIVQSFNMSAGITLLSALVEQAATALNDSYDIEILEMHHRHKVDAPSGTALLLGEAAAKGRGTTLKQVEKLSREGLEGARPTGEIGFATLRGGEVIGDHEVMFAGSSERITLKHQSSSRTIYAEGALRAAKWVTNQPSGLYSMRDVLGV